MAHICRLADVDVITAYPIRPYDTVMQYVSKFIAEGEFDADYIPAESEHGQFEIVKHASACGARVFTGSSGVGWLYAMEPDRRYGRPETAHGGPGRLPRAG